MSHLKRNTLARHCRVPGSSAPPGWVKFWWFADYIQYDNQRKLQKKHPRFFSERIHVPADSFISNNEGMNEGCPASSLTDPDVQISRFRFFMGEPRSRL